LREYLKLIYEGQQTTNRELQALRGEMQEQKRKLEQLQSELDKRPYIDPTQKGLYHYLKLEIDRAEGVSGIRASIYKFAGETGAY
jgi:predicted  nucleic acid-binding Zn-ribbon protein